jgi:glycosyltransferase involved in cell wall biosynthesis
MDLSIIVPVFNEEKFIASCLDAIQSGLKRAEIKYEVIVVDNGSTDGTPMVLSGYADIMNLGIKRSSVAHARNFGASRANGNILAFIDGDVLITNEWVNAMENFIADSLSLDTLTGYQCKPMPDGGWIERYWFSGLVSSHINSGNLIISKSGFDWLGGFNEKLKTGEDVDICERAKLSNKVKFQKNQAFVAIHLDYPRTLKRFFLREVWHGEGDFKDLKFFFQSKVAMVSIVYGIFSFLVLLALGLGSWLYSAFFLTFLIAFNLLVIIYRFSIENLKTMMVRFALNYIYFMARFFSIFSAFYKINRKY